MNILNDIATWLASTSTGFGQIGSGSTYAIYKYQKPASTENMHILYMSGGTRPDILSDFSIDNPSFQVITLSAATSDLGFNQALKIQNRLRFIANRKIPTSTGSHYIYIYPIQAPIALGLDENRRMQWSQNFSVKVSYD